MEHLVMAMERWMEKDVSRPQCQETRRSEDKGKEKSGRSSLLNSPYKKMYFKRI